MNKHVELDDTDRHAAIRLNHLSPTWVRILDERLGRAKVENGGYLDLHVKFERGRVRWFDLLQRFLTW